MGRQICADRVDPIFFEQDPVEFALNLFVGDLSLRGEVVDITVAGAVQRKVAQEAAQIGVVRLAGAPGQEDLSRLRKVFSAGQTVHASALGVERVMGEGPVVKEQVRSVHTDVEQIFFLQKDIPVFFRQRLQYILSEAIVRVSCGHRVLLL